MISSSNCVLARFDHDSSAAALTASSTPMLPFGARILLSTVMVIGIAHVAVVWRWVEIGKVHTVDKDAQGFPSDLRGKQDCQDMLELLEAGNVLVPISPASIQTCLV